MAYEPITLLPDDARLTNVITSVINELALKMSELNVVEWNEEFHAGPNGSLLRIHQVMSMYMNYDNIVRIYAPYSNQDEYIASSMRWLRIEGRSLAVNLITTIEDGISKIPHKDLVMPMVEHLVRVFQTHKLCEVGEQFAQELIIYKLSK